MNIAFNNVSFSYGSKEEIKNVSFKVNKGEFVALIGSNGAGKSTLVKLSCGLLKPKSGEVLLDGKSTKAVKTSALAGKIGFLFQNPDRQICCATAREEVLFTPKQTGTVTDEICKKADALLQKFNIDPSAEPFCLSCGQRQILALLSVLITNLEVLIIDEPTTGLDYHECTRIMEEIKEMNERGTTVIAVCHDMEIVIDYMHRAIVLNAGEILADGKTADIFRNETVLNTAGILPPQIMQIAHETDMEGVCYVEDAVSYIKNHKKA